MILNNKELVKISKFENKDKEGIEYYFCANTNSVEESNFHNEIIKKFLKDEDQANIGIGFVSYLCYSLYQEGWEFVSLITDMWMKVTVISDSGDTRIVVECNQLEVGLLSALLFAREINKC